MTRVRYEERTFNNFCLRLRVGQTTSDREVFFLFEELTTKIQRSLTSYKECHDAVHGLVLDDRGNGGVV